MLLIFTGNCSPLGYGLPFPNPKVKVKEKTYTCNNERADKYSYCLFVGEELRGGQILILDVPMLLGICSTIYCWTYH